MTGDWRHPPFSFYFIPLSCHRRMSTTDMWFHYCKSHTGKATVCMPHTACVLKLASQSVYSKKVINEVFFSTDGWVILVDVLLQVMFFRCKGCMLSNEQVISAKGFGLHVVNVWDYLTFSTICIYCRLNWWIVGMYSLQLLWHRKIWCWHILVLLFSVYR